MKAFRGAGEKCFFAARNEVLPGAYFSTSEADNNCERGKTMTIAKQS